MAGAWVDNLLRLQPSSQPPADAGNRQALLRIRTAALAVLLAEAFQPVWFALAQQPQNPSPMVEHTRTHPRLTEETQPGRHEKLDLGTLFIPEARKPRDFLFFF